MYLKYFQILFDLVFEILFKYFQIFFYLRLMRVERQSAMLFTYKLQVCITKLVNQFLGRVNGTGMSIDITEKL